MIFLFLSIFCSALIGNLLTLFKVREKIKIFQVFLGNYLVASLFSFFSMNNNFSSLHVLDYSLGIFAGFMFLVNFIVYQKNIHANGLSLSVSIMRVSMIIPSAVSILLFFDKINLLNYFGISVIVVSFFILADTRKFHHFFWLLLLFVVTGISDTTLKLYDEIGYQDNTMFVFILFSSALVFNFLLIMLRKEKFHLLSLGCGLILGIPNQLTTRFFLSSLKFVPGSLAYPISASGIVVVVILSDILIWKKRFNAKQRIALFLLLIGLIFLNLK